MEKVIKLYFKKNIKNSILVTDHNQIDILQDKMHQVE